MAVPGPTDRTYTIDDNAGVAKVVTPLIVGEPTGIGKIEEAMQDFVGPASISPVIVPAGYYDVPDVTVEFRADVGGAIDPTEIFHVNRGGSRTFDVTFAAGWTFSSESYIKSVEPKAPPKGKATLAVTFSFTGDATIT